MVGVEGDSGGWRGWEGNGGVGGDTIPCTQSN